MFKVGDFIKCKRKFGIIQDVYENGRYICISHNGMKPCSFSAAEDELKKITKEQFIAWIKRSGYTSMYSYF